MFLGHFINDRWINDGIFVIQLNTSNTFGDICDFQLILDVKMNLVTKDFYFLSTIINTNHISNYMGFPSKSIGVNE